MQELFNITLKFGSSAHILYESSGGSEDWAKLKANIPYTYVIELKPDDSPDQSGAGFIYPEDLIVKSAEEIYFGLKEYMKIINKNNYSKNVLKKCKEILGSMLNYDKS